MKVWGNLLSARKPYEVVFVIEGRRREQIRSAEWRQIEAKLNRQRPAKEVGTGWHIYQVGLRPVQTWSYDETWTEYQVSISGDGVVGTLSLFLKEGE